MTQHVLIIDDDVAVREALLDLLDLYGVQAVAVGSGQAGIAYVIEHRSEVAVIVVDMQMPGMNGAEVIEALDAVAPEMRIILASGYAQETLTVRLRNHNVARLPDRILQKPYEPEHLVEQIRALLQDSSASLD